MGIENIERGVAEIKQMLLKAQPPVPATDEPKDPSAIQSALDSMAIAISRGNRTEAIKRLMDATGLPLSNAKQWVDWMCDHWDVKRK